MSKVVANILKADDVKLEGQFHLNITQSGQIPSRLATPQAHIVENKPDFVVIELLCCCGAKTYLRCNYVGKQPQNSVSSISDNKSDKKIKGEKNDG